MMQARHLILITAALAAVAIAAPLKDADAIVAEPEEGKTEDWESVASVASQTEAGATFVKDANRVATLKHRLRTLNRNRPRLMKMALKYAKRKVKRIAKSFKAARNNLKAVTKGQQLMKAQVTNRQKQVAKASKALKKYGSSKKKDKKWLRKAKKWISTAKGRLARKVKEKKDGLVSVKAAQKRVKKLSGDLEEEQDKVTRFKDTASSTRDAIKATKVELALRQKKLKAIMKGDSTSNGKTLAAARQAEKGIWADEIKTAKKESKTLKEARKDASHESRRQAADDEAYVAGKIKKDLHSLEWEEAWVHKAVKMYKDKVHGDKKKFKKAKKAIQHIAWDYYKDIDEEKSKAKADEKAAERLRHLFHKA